ncbi:hypothetical protein [Spiroplasma sp. AdecLV25b]|uniref:hypothetical protein n=1 Tax=Spiroplasma sp. AdecLV25b TaxID=3027162 RepID=UPI0027E13CC0|nr:hypothetical protein [Spiroplasma sp. AdecLV25b]
MGWFGKKKDKSMNMDQVKCEGCGKMNNASECVKSADGKCLCKDCAANQEANK